VRIEVFERALDAADSNLEKDSEKREIDTAKRELRIYFDALDKAKEMGKDKTEAENYANNELTRAGLERMDSRQKLAEKIKQEREIARYMRLAGGGKD
jgi:hypothetical protein